MSTCWRSSARPGSGDVPWSTASRRSLATGFVYTRHDLSEDLLDTAYAMLREFFALEPEVKQQFTVPGAHGQTGYTGLLVETAASSDEPDWKEMLNWAPPIAGRASAEAQVPAPRTPTRCCPRRPCRASPRCCTSSTTRSPTCNGGSCGSSPRASAATQTFFDEMVDRRADAHPRDPLPTDDRGRPARTPRVGRRARRHQPDHRPAAGHARPACRCKVDDEWVDAVAPEGQVIINTGIMLERLTNGADPDRLAPRRRRARATRASATASSSSATRRRGRSCPRCRVAARRSTRSASPRISAADALDEVLYEINLVEDTRRLTS